jgi:hypothetical protein
LDTLGKTCNKLHGSPHTGSNPVLTTKNKSMKNKNLKAIVGLVLAIVLVVVMGYILILTNNI